MITLFSGRTADEVWLKAAQCLIKGKVAHNKPSRGGDTREILHVGFSISDPRQRWVFSRVPPINIAFALAEIIWIMNGRNDAKFLTYWNSQLPKYVGNGRHLHGAYGFRLRYHLKYDQLRHAYYALKANPYSRQVLLQIWDSRIDLPNHKGYPVDKDIPCNVVSLLKVFGGKLEWCQIMRSNDIQLGTPYNFIQFTYLQEIMAGWLNLEIGTYNHISDSLHAYTGNLKDIQRAKRLKLKDNIDIISLPYPESQKCFRELSRRIDTIEKGNCSERKLRIISDWPYAPIGYRNILLVLVAESARKMKYYDLSMKSIEICNNPALKSLWIRWANRFTKKINLSNSG